MGLWFKKNRDQKTTMVMQALSATSTRAMYDTVSQSRMPVIVSYFELKQPRRDGVEGTEYVRVEVEMDLFEANKYASSLMAAIDAAMPRRARGKLDIPWE